MCIRDRCAPSVDRGARGRGDTWYGDRGIAVRRREPMPHNAARGIPEHRPQDIARPRGGAMALFHDGKLTVGRLRLDHPRRDTPEMERTASVAMPEDLGAEVPLSLIHI